LLIFSSFRIDYTVKEPFAVTWRLLEFDGISVIILFIPWSYVAWLMPYLIVNSSASDVTLIVWWMVFMMEQFWQWICMIDMVTQFLILTFITTRDIKKSSKEVRAILSRDRQCALRLLSLLFFTMWNEKWSSKRSMILCPGLNSLLRESNNRTILLYLFLMSII